MEQNELLSQIIQLKSGDYLEVSTQLFDKTFQPVSTKTGKHEFEDFLRENEFDTFYWEIKVASYNVSSFDPETYYIRHLSVEDAEKKRHDIRRWPFY